MIGTCSDLDIIQLLMARRTQVAGYGGLLCCLAGAVLVHAIHAPALFASPPGPIGIGEQSDSDHVFCRFFFPKHVFHRFWLFHCPKFIPRKIFRCRDSHGVVSRALALCPAPVVLLGNRKRCDVHDLVTLLSKTFRKMDK